MRRTTTSVLLLLALALPAGCDRDDSSTATTGSTAGSATPAMPGDAEVNG